MATEPKSLFTSLDLGDLLMVPITLPASKESLTAFAAVLRLGDNGEFYLGRLSEHRPDPRPGDGNPYRWSDDKGALVDKEGDVPRWYTVNIQLERRGALKAAQSYTTVPRLGEARHPVSDDLFKQFMEKDPRHAVLEGIVVNGEAGSPATQLSLALDVMGVPHDEEQAIGLGYFIERLAAQRTIRALIISGGETVAPAETGPSDAKK